MGEGWRATIAMGYRRAIRVVAEVYKTWTDGPSSKTHTMFTSREHGTITTKGLARHSFASK